MHDVLAHRLSLLSVHASALEFDPDAPAEEVAEAAGVIRQSAKSALEIPQPADAQASRRLALS
jgi:signal transduction histidine kinase